MLRIGLTGGIASGKTAVGQQLRELGVPVVDADQLARRVVEPGTPTLAKIVERFGEQVLTPEGTLDRQALGHLVFANAEARAALEALTHPPIAAEAYRQLTDWAAEGHAYAVYEAPLIVEAGLVSLFDRLVVVVAPRERQLQRLHERDGLTRHEAEQRLAAQTSTEEKVRLADEVLHNDGSLADLRTQVHALHQRLVQLAQEEGNAP